MKKNGWTERKLDRNYCLCLLLTVSLLHIVFNAICKLYNLDVITFLSLGIFTLFIPQIGLKKKRTKNQVPH